jgi:hypothetical protein
MDQRAKTGVRDEPFAAGVEREVNGLFRTKIYTDATALALNGVYFIVFTNGIPTAQIPT